MRITLLTTALLMATTLACADEPPAAEAKTEATATQPSTASAADTVARSDASATSSAEKEEKPFKPPPGYRPKRINGEQVYCAKLVVLGSRFPKEDCRSETDLRELALRREEMRRDVESTRSICASNNGACGQN
jgi:hypothetical protein